MVPIVALIDPVGPKSPNRPVDVAIVQDLVAVARTGRPGEAVDGVPTAMLFDDIAVFQRDTMKTLVPDSTVDPGGRTLAALFSAAGASYKGPLIFRQPPAGPWALLDRQRFVDLFAQQFKDPQTYNWTAPRPIGLRTVLDAIVGDAAITDLRWAADMLATVQRETGRFVPLEEGGKGAGYPYGVPATFTAADGKTYTNVYYGRGYVQLTHLENYLRLGQLLGLGEALAIDPARALEPGIAYQVMSYGMRNGSFTNHKLADYISGDNCDYREARRIINGTDKARELAVCAGWIEGLLWLATRARFGASIYLGGTAR